MRENFQLHETLNKNLTIEDIDTLLEKTKELQETIESTSSPEREHIIESCRETERVVEKTIFQVESCISDLLSIENELSSPLVKDFVGDIVKMFESDRADMMQFLSLTGNIVGNETSTLVKVHQAEMHITPQQKAIDALGERATQIQNELTHASPDEQSTIIEANGKTISILIDTKSILEEGASELAGVKNHTSSKLAHDLVMGGALVLAVKSENIQSLLAHCEKIAL